ncbi:hypothetical protein P4910_21445 [Pantoea stewartii]|uniref:hypothetical protein n=1 Tax=Pantoea stewartii TaxID=66269 RepID=UPI0023F97B3F|nr:hypothetical protein [Pantoea stewartii]MDF7788017.1 hypothetical protein [Pantoea stewartii]
MTEHKERKVNIAVGEALLSLLDSDADISTETLSAELKRFAEAEPGLARRQSATAALRQIAGLSVQGGRKPGAEERPAGVILPWGGVRH